MTDIIIFLGPPGAGKGTQASRIAEENNLAHISTGDMLREHVSNNSELGRKAKSLLDEGKLVPDALVIDMLTERLNADDCKNGAILDGFPRTLAQAQSLEKVSEYFQITKVIVFEADNDESFIQTMIDVHSRHKERGIWSRNALEFTKKHTLAKVVAPYGNYLSTL